MPILEIPNYGPVSFPEGMPEAEIQARAQRLAERVAERIAYKPDYRDLGIGKLASSGFSRATTGLGSLVTDLIPALVGSTMGYDNYAREQLAEAAAKKEKAEEESPTAFRSYKDVGGIGQGLGYIAETAGELGPDMAAMLLGGGLPGALVKRGVTKGAARLVAERAAETAAKRGLAEDAAAAYAEQLAQRTASRYTDEAAANAAKLATGAGLYGTSLGLNTPDVFEGIYEKTGRLEPGIALVAGAGQAVLDSLVPARVLSQFSKESRDLVANQLLQQSTLIPPTFKAAFAKSLLATSASEGVTEGAQELISLLAEQAAGSGGKLFSPENIDRIVNASIKGAVGGGLFGTPGAIVEARQKKQEAQRILAERKAANAPAEVPEVPEMPTASALVEAASPEAVSPEAPVATPPESVEPEAELATRAAAQGAANAPTVEPTEPITPVEPVPPTTVAPPIGEGVSVVSGPSGVPPTEGVGVSEPAGVAPAEPPVSGVVGGEGAAPPALAEEISAPPAVPVAPTAPVSDLEALHRELVDIAQQRMDTMTKGGRIPFKNSPARAKFDALGIQLQEKKDAWKALTGEEVDIQSLFTGTFTPPAAPVAEVATPAPVAEVAAPAPVVEAPVAEAPTKPKLTGAEMLVRAEEAQRKADEAAAPAEVKPAEPAAPKAEPKAKKEAKPKAEAEKPEYTKEKRTALEQQRAAEVKQVTTLFQDVTGTGYRQNDEVAENVTTKDEEVVHHLLTAPAATVDADARAYFSKVPRIVDALRNIAFDVVNETPHFRKSGERNIEAKFFEGTGGKSAEAARAWVEKNLGPTATKQFDTFLKAEEKSARATRKALEEHQATDKKRARYGKNLKKQLEAEATEAAQEASKELRASKGIVETQQELEPDEIDLDLEGWMGSRDNLFAGVTSQFAIPLHPAVRGALSNGQLGQALSLLSSSSSGRIRDLANVFAKVGMTSRISVVENLTDASGKRVPGFFDPKTNSVFLDAELGMNTHTLFHELSHAATSHVLANPSHPVTKQLTSLFNDVKDTLDTAYGAQSLDEFVAEAWANDEFKGQLNSINPKGEAITAWQRFTNTIRNFFRRLMGREAVPLGTAFDVADKAIMSILSPSPTYRDGTALYAATVNPRDPSISNWLNEKTDWLATLPAMNQQRADSVNQFLRDVAGSKAKKLLFSILPLDTMVDIAKKYLPDAPLVNALVNERKGDEYKRNQKIESVIIEVEKWAKAVGVAAVEKFDSIVYKSTTEQVDPTRARSFYDNKFPNDPKAQQELLATYDELHRELNALGAPAVRVYKLMRETYASLRKEVLDSIDARVNETVADPEARKKFKNELLKKLAEKGEIDPYFPLTRNGAFWLSFHAPSANGSTEYYVEACETEIERDRRIADLKDAGAKNIQKFSNLSEISYKNVPNTAFVHGVLQAMEFHRPTDTTKQQEYDAAMEGILRLYLTTMPETAFAKSFATRKNVLGFRKDSIRALRERSYSMSRQLSNMKYAAALTQVRQKMADYVTKLGKSGASPDNKLAKEYFDEMNKRISFAISPTVSKAAQLINTFSFTTLLGFNISSAVVNLSQIPLIVFPYLGGKYGYGATTRAIDDATRAFMGGGRARDVEVMGANGEKIKRAAMPSLDNIDFDAPNLPASLKKYKPMVEAARRMGQFNRSQMSDVLEVEDRTSPMARVNAASGFFMHHGERFNREVTLMATYDLELQRLNGPKATAVEKALTPEAKQTLAAEHSIYMAELTNGGTSAAAAAPIAQNAIGRVLFMFKSYGVKMNYLLFKTLNESMRGEAPEIRAAARKQLAGIMGSAALFAGVQGLPLFGVVAMIYNMFKDDDDEDFGAVVRGYTGESVYKGLVNKLTGLSIAERVGLSNLIFKESPMASGSATVVDTLAQTLGGPFIGVVGRMERGIKLMADGNVERGLESMLPVSFGNVLKGIRYGTEGANTLRGDPIMGDVNAWNAAAQMLGFTPAEYTRQLEVNASLKGIEKAIITERTQQLRKLNTAAHLGDTSGEEEARNKLEKLYEKYPELGNLNETVARSRRAFDMTEPVNGIIMNNKLKERLLEIKAEQEGS